MGRGGAKIDKAKDSRKKLPVDENNLREILQAMLLKEGASKAEAQASLQQRSIHYHTRRIRFSDDDSYYYLY